LFVAVLGLSACNGSDSSTTKKEADSTLSDLANAKAELEKVNAQVSALELKLNNGLSAVAVAQGDRDRLVKEAAAEVIKRDAATKELVRLAGKDGGGGLVKAATDELARLSGEADIAVKTLKSAQDELAVLDGHGTGSIFEAEEALKKLTGDKGTLTEATKTLDDRKKALLKLEGDPKTGATGDISKAQASLERLIGKDGKSGEVGDADSKLTKLKTDLETAKEDLKLAIQTLEKLQGKDGKGGDIAVAQKLLADLGVELDKARQDLATAREEWKRLRGEDGKGGEIAAAQKRFDDLVKLAGDKAEEIRKAGLELDRLRVDGKAITEKATLDAARMRAEAAFDTGRFAEAVKFLTDAKLHDEAMAMIDKSAQLLTAAGKHEEAYKLYAPQDHVRDDKNAYRTSPASTIAFDKVDETPSVKRHSIQLDGKTIWLTAKAGHLIAYAQKNKKSPEAERDPQAAVFYMSYTRDDLPKNKRPVIFFFNGGPGEASIWMHLGAFGAKRIKLDQPKVPETAKSGEYLDYPFLDNPGSLIDKADLVFVDPVGNGYSHAITSALGTHKDKDFWGVDTDARVMRDFITRYINVNNRQSSPKYLYGESYGGGIRVPILTKLLLDAGTSNYDEDNSGKPAVVLTGSVFHSPVLDFGGNCIDNKNASCAGFFPTYAMTADAFKQSTARGNRTIDEYMQEVRKFAKEINLPATRKVLDGTFPAFSQTDGGKSYIKELERFTGLSNTWSGGINISPTGDNGFMTKLKPGYTVNVYDMRMVIQGRVNYKFSYAEDPAFHKQIKAYLPDYFNYNNSSYYEASLSVTTRSFEWDWSSRGGRTKTNTLEDITQALNYAPGLKLMVTHGYFDGRTPTFQSELDLDKTVKINGKDVNLLERIPLHNFEGGHMMYHVESELPKLKKTIVDFIDAPPYSPPNPEQKSAALN
jgi:carboxypeptidase C (cathepsin A)